MTDKITADRSGDSHGRSGRLQSIPRWAYWAGAAVVTVAAFWIATRPGEKAFMEIVTTAEVTRGHMEITVTGPGRVRAANAMDVDVPGNVRGELQLIYLVPEGTVVQEGDIIARLDTTTAVQRLENALDQLETTEASFEQLLEDQTNSILDLENSVRSAELSYALAELQLKNLEFSSELEQRQGELNLENARISRDEAKRKLAAQKIINEAERTQREINLEGRRREVEETRDELEALVIFAPISGLVIHAEQGRWSERTKIHEGDNVRRGQEIVELPDLSVLLVEVRINELDAERVRIGQMAYVRFEAYPRLVLEGRVTDISTLAQETMDGGNVKVFPAVVTLDDADPRVRPGMTASADIVVEELEDVLCIPLSAVGVVEQKTYVKPVGAEEPVEITLGMRNESEAQILEGLEAGDWIELGWMRDPSAVLSILAGQNPVPEVVARSIIAQGEEYGKARTVRGMEGIPEMLSQLREGLPDSLKAEVDSIIESGEFNFRSLSPALTDSLRARGGFGRMFRRPPPGQADQPPPPPEGLLDGPENLSPEAVSDTGVDYH